MSTDKNRPNRGDIVRLIARVVPIALIGIIFAFEAYTLVVSREGGLPLPPLFGNLPANRAVLERVREPGPFAFAVVGDTKSLGTFERIADTLRETPLDFAVLLGDCSYGGTEEQHRYFRAECASECALPFPVFYVVGNHDVSPDGFPVKRFEEVYGPSIFSFEHRQCLFIVLRFLEGPFTNDESMAFLAKFRDVDLSRYRHTFAFMHIPPVVSPALKARTFAESEKLVALLEEIGIEYVFAGDFHGFAQSKRGRTTYIVTGGGGSNLAKIPGNQFHHATLVYVTPSSVDIRIAAFPAAVDLEDALEKLAITEVWPWMLRNASLAAGLNFLCGLALVPLVGALIRHNRRTAELKPTA